MMHCFSEFRAYIFTKLNLSLYVAWHRATQVLEMLAARPARSGILGGQRISRLQQNCWINLKLKNTPSNLHHLLRGSADILPTASSRLIILPSARAWAPTHSWHSLTHGAETVSRLNARPPSTCRVFRSQRKWEEYRCAVPAHTSAFTRHWRYSPPKQTTAMSFPSNEQLLPRRQVVHCNNVLKVIKFSVRNQCLVLVCM